jgi:hypothetical protein
MDAAFAAKEADSVAVPSVTPCKMAEPDESR